MTDQRAEVRPTCKCRIFDRPHHPDACYSTRLEKQLMRLETQMLGWTDHDLLRNTRGF